MQRFQRIHRVFKEKNVKRFSLSQSEANRVGCLAEMRRVGTIGLYFLPI